MTRLTDETLMRYADGLLEAAEGERIAAIAAHDGELRARIEAFRMTGGNLADLFDGYLKSPALTLKLGEIPAPDMEGVIQLQPAGVASPRRFREAVERLGPMLLPLAAGLALVCGIGLGWLLRGESGSPMTVADVVAYRGGKLVAQGALKQALETMPSSPQTSGAQAAAGGLSPSIRMTFQDEAGRYCREYQFGAAAERHAGVACRTDGGDWTINFQALLPAAPQDRERIIPAASSRAAMDAAVGTVIVGDPLAADSEAALLSRHWER